MIKLQTTGIGSLPHHNIDTAIESSFRCTIPFFPQIPIRNPREFMLAQALEGLPGLEVRPDGSVVLNTSLWDHRAFDFKRKLAQCFELASQRPMSFAEFDPSPIHASCWKPFLWELEERKLKRAKAQIAGPLTCQWALRTEKGNPVDSEVGHAVHQLILARSLAMVQTLKNSGIQPVFFLDEPGLYALNLSDPHHWLSFQQLKIAIQTLKQGGVQVGVHCCSNTNWKALLALPMDFVSIDTHLSFPGLLEMVGTAGLISFVQRGGRFSFGVLPTRFPSLLDPPLEPKKRVLDLWKILSQAMKTEPQLLARVISESIYSPACGLALSSANEVELIQQALMEISDEPPPLPI